MVIKYEQNPGGFVPRFHQPPILALYATPTPHLVLLTAAATSPAHRVPCLKQTHSDINTIARYDGFQFSKAMGFH